MIESSISKQTVEERADAWGEGFMQVVLNEIIKPIVNAFQSQSENGYQFPDKLAKLLQKIGRDAYYWSFSANTTYLHHDFHLILFHPCAFVADDMQLGDKYKLSPDGSTTVASVGLGLKSSVALGHDKDPEAVWQEKVPVITEEYFQD